MRACLLAIICLWSVSIQAQHRLGIQFGYITAKWNPSNDPTFPSDATYTTSPVNGLQFGLVGEIRLINNLSIRPGLFLTGKGTTLNYLRNSLYYDSSSLAIWVRYIEVPVTFVYHIVLSKQLKTFLGGGLYAAKAYSGEEGGEGRNERYTYYMYSKVVIRSHNENQAYPTTIKPFDYGYSFMFGVQLSKVQLLLNYNYGLQKVVGNNFIGNYYNKTLGISLAYLVPTQEHKQTRQ